MARYEFRLPDIGEGTAEAECVAWHVAVGDAVAEDQPLLDVMTDKATVEVTSPVAGTVVRRIGEVGAALPVGGVVLVFDLAEGEGEGEGESDLSGPEPAPAPHIAAPAAAPAAPAPAAAPARALTSPALRKRAADLGVDLSAVVGTGPHGRIRQSDLESHLAGAGGSGSTAAEPRRFAFVAEPGGVRKPVIGLRRRIAERLQDTKRRIPHFSYIEEADLTQLERLRAQLNGEGKDRPRLTLLPFLIRALVEALPDFPHLNARYDDAAGVLHEHADVHVGIATQTPAGLVVTVLRDAGRHDLWACAAELQRLSAAARAGKATPAELSGSTITITSLGAIGGLATTPVINSPEVAILGVNKLVERPVVRAGRIEVATMMNLSASFDHRIVDGWDAAQFVQRVKALLEAPATMFLAPPARD